VRQTRLFAHQKGIDFPLSVELQAFVTGMWVSIPTAVCYLLRKILAHPLEIDFLLEATIAHQLAGRLVSLAHGFLVCPIRSSYMSRQRWQRSIQLSSIETQSEPL